MLEEIFFFSFFLWKRFFFFVFNYITWIENFLNKKSLNQLTIEEEKKLILSSSSFADQLLGRQKRKIFDDKFWFIFFHMKLWSLSHIWTPWMLWPELNRINKDQLRRSLSRSYSEDFFFSGVEIFIQRFINQMIRELRKRNTRNESIDCVFIFFFKEVFNHYI